MKITTLHKQHDDQTTELEILGDNRLLATVTVSGGWIDITYERIISDKGSFELLRIDDKGNVIISEPTLG
jgi:hypothetical protein